MKRLSQEERKRHIFDNYMKKHKITDKEWKFCEKIDWHPCDELPLKKSFIRRLERIRKSKRLISYASNDALRLDFGFKVPKRLKNIHTFHVTRKEGQRIVKTFYTAKLTKEDNWYVSECREIPTYSQGKTIKSALTNLAEATELYLEEFPKK